MLKLLHYNAAADDGAEVQKLDVSMSLAADDVIRPRPTMKSVGLGPK